MAVAGMVLGIIALIFGFIPLFGAFIAFPCLAVGLPLSGVAFYRGLKDETGKGMAIAGIATNIVALIIIVLWIFVFAVSSDELAGASASSTSELDREMFPCLDLEREYSAMWPVTGRDNALMHVSNMMNLTDGDPLAYYTIGDAERALQDCGVISR